MSEALRLAAEHEEQKKVLAKVLLEKQVKANRFNAAC